MDFPAQVRLELVLHWSEQELPVHGTLDVPLRELLGFGAADLEVAPEGPVTGGSALAACLDNDGRHAQGLGDLLQGSAIWNDIFHDEPQGHGSRAGWGELLECHEELVPDARNWPEEDTLGVLEAWPAFKGTACVSTPGGTFAWEAGNHDCDFRRRL